MACGVPMAHGAADAMKIFITGIGGFLGGALAAHLAARGHEVRGSRRSEMQLGAPFDASVFAGTEVVIHCAHDFTAGARPRNVDGTRMWFDAAAAQGARLQVLLSSYSARPGADSEYGQTKFEMERMFQTRLQTSLQTSLQIVLRPGLVMGDGGLYRKQRAALLRMPVVPVIGDGLQPTAVIRIEDFLEAATVVIEGERTGAFNLFYEKQPSYRELVRAIKAEAGQRTIFVPIPAGLALALARAAEALHLPVPVKPGQIRALMGNQSAPWRSDLAGLLPEARAAPGS
jgi:nucleoside-diphosphate-sugar epimerase